MGGNLFYQLHERPWEASVGRSIVQEISEQVIRETIRPFAPQSVSPASVKRMRERCHLTIGESCQSQHQEVTILYVGY
jgi:hypothetical protein